MQEVGHAGSAHSRQPPLIETYLVMSLEERMTFAT